MKVFWIHYVHCDIAAYENVECIDDDVLLREYTTGFVVSTLLIALTVHKINALSHGMKQNNLK